MKPMNQLFYILLTAAVGTCLPLMSSANGTLGKTIGSPLASVLLAFLIAASVIYIIMLISGAKFPAADVIKKTNFMMWVGGFFIAMNIITFTIGPQKIGISNVIVIFVSSQLISSLLVEHFGLLHFAVHKINWQRSLGALLLMGGVILIKKY